MSRSEDDLTRDRVQVQASNNDREAVNKLKLGDMVKLYDTNSYNGLYQLRSVENGSFTIDAPFQYNEVGRWEVMEKEDTGLVFDGIVTRYEKADDGKLKVHAQNHQLENGDWVQIVDTPDLGGEYPIVQHDGNSFTVQRLWVNGEAVNIKLESRKRRGLVFDGQKDWIQIPLDDPLKLGANFTLEAWVKLNRADNQTILATELEPPAAGTVSQGWRATLGVHGGKFSFAYMPVNLQGETEKRLNSASEVKLNEWVHVACTFDGKVLRLLENGVVTATKTASNLSDTEQGALLQRLRDEVSRLNSSLLSAALPPYDNAKIVSTSGKALSSRAADDDPVLVPLAEQPEQTWRLHRLNLANAVERCDIRNIANQKSLKPSGSRVMFDRLHDEWLLKLEGSGKFTISRFQYTPKPATVYLQEDSSGKIFLSPTLDDSGYWNVFRIGKENELEDLEAQLVKAQAALSAAEAAAIPHIPLSNARSFTLAGQSLTGVATNPVQLLKGQIADVRVWTRALQPKDIENSMHLQLTGRETDLQGYWRLGGVAMDDEGVQRVYDFGVNANHGIAHGSPYGGGITLSSKLGDNTTPATRYSNHELFAVSEGATYVESFEFRTTAPVDPNNIVNSSNSQIFKPALWGRLSRTAEDKQEFSPLDGENYQFESTGEEGWHRATCRFMVPQGVRLLRCFEVSNVLQGKWNTLEIRRHSVKLVSDTVTRSNANETAKLKSLAGVTGVDDPVSMLPELERKEKEEARLITRKKELDAAIAAFGNIARLKKEHDDQQILVQNLLSQKNQLETAYNKEVNDPLNYWCKIEAKHSQKYLDVKWGGLSTYTSVIQHYWIGTDNQKWAFEPAGGGSYRIKAKHSNYYLEVANCSQENWAAIWQMNRRDWGVLSLLEPYQKWLLVNHESNYYQIKSTHSQKYLDVLFQHGEDYAPIVQHEFNGKDNQKWKIEKVSEETTNSNIGNVKRSFDEKENEYKAENARLTQLKKTLEETNQSEQQLNADLEIVKTKLGIVQGQISTLTTNYLKLVSGANNKVQMMTNLDNQADPRGLKVQGALLPFAQAASRLHALESCTGRVTLSYQDRNGNLRQTHYDSAYDADSKGEQWLPEGYRVALKLTENKTENKTARTLPSPIFNSISSQITIEFWAKGGENLPKAVTFLGARNTDNATCLRIQLPNEKGEVVWEAGSPSGNTTIDRLQVATEIRFYRENWTHWAFVKNCDKGEMCIYRNGKLIYNNDPKAKENPVVLSQPIVGVTQAELGGFPGSNNASNWSGQITELRIWNVALGERELETNSLLTLSGNEPGLVAYYPMNEAGEIRDLTGTAAHKLTIADAIWTPCTAPIGRFSSAIELLNSPTKFDDTTTFVQLPALDIDFSQGLTIEARVRFEQFNKASRIVDLGIGEANQNIVLSNKGSTNGLTFLTIVNGQWQELSVDNVLPEKEWVHLAVTVAKDGTSKLYVNSQEKKNGNLTLPTNVLRTSNFIGKSNWSGDGFFKGEMDYVRVWQKALTKEEIDSSSQGQHITTPILIATTPILIATEYTRMVVDPQRRKTAMMMRCLALTGPDGVRLFDEQRIEELEMKWIGNAQIDPTLIGYIEGAPPLPSENLTLEDNYNSATSVELIQSSDLSYSWTREQDASQGLEGEALLGAKSQTTAGIGVETTIEDTEVRAGFQTNFAYHWQNASRVSAGQSLSQSNRLELRGSQEQDAHFPLLGKRFVPKNVGYALVTSGLADVFVSKLRKSGRMVGYQVLPVEGVPIDVNTITFMINPAYTMAGSLDGMTGTRATSQRVFGQVPEMRTQYGSLYPASYFRLQEAYDLKKRIDNQDLQHQAYFNQFNAGLVDQTSLNGQAGGPNMTASSSEIEALKKQIKTKNAEIKTKNAEKKAEGNKPTPDRAKVDLLKDQIEDLEEEVKELGEQKQELMEEEQDANKADVEQRQKEIEAVHSDLSAREHASTSFAAWQRTMEGLQVRAGKRNIVNTYIWDADGGFHAEEQQFASTIEHSIGGSFDFSIALGVKAKVAITKVLVESKAYTRTKLTQTMSKTEASGKGMELRVNVDGVESRGITDHRDYPILPGEKVDRYRFMSFYLEKKVDHWHDFFNQVVDPEWLASNDEEARALRQTQNALPNEVWRVLHRVTYVERPALMGFGHQQPPRVQVADEMQKLRGQVSQLTAKLESIDSKLNRLLEGK